MDLALNNLQRLICHKTKPTNQPSLWNDISGSIKLIAERIDESIPFPKGISPKVTVIVRLELEHANYVVQHVSHYTTGTSPNSLSVI